MSTQRPRPITSLAAEIADCNLAVSEYFHMSIRVYKSIKALTFLSAVGLGLVAIRHGADPLTIYTLVATILVGPEVLEMRLSENGKREK